MKKKCKDFDSQFSQKGGLAAHKKSLHNIFVATVIFSMVGKHQQSMHESRKFPCKQCITIETKLTKSTDFSPEPFLTMYDSENSHET